MSPIGHKYETVIDYGAAKSQGMFPLLSTLLLSDFTTYEFIR